MTACYHFDDQDPDAPACQMRHDETCPLHRRDGVVDLAIRLAKWKLRAQYLAESRDGGSEAYWRQIDQEINRQHIERNP